MTADRLIALIPLLPGLGATLLGLTWLYGKKLPKLVTSWISCGVVALAFAVSVFEILSLRAMAPESRHITQELWTWFSFLPGGRFDIPFAFEVDPLSAVMIFVVTGIGFLIHLYSTVYMGADAGYQKFMAYLNLFMFSMLTLVLGNNFLMMFIGWEGVGLCSYLLIGFWWHETPNANAAKKAFVVNRVGDFLFVTGLMALVWGVGWDGGHHSMVFREMKEHLDAFTAAQGNASLRVLGIPLITFATLCFFGGATGKSAQIPLYVWLPDAMAGPTPVSALIHAATMVTAGIYMITRLNFLFSLAPATLLVVCAIGTATAVIAASIGLFQYDIKKVLAYSTVSQLGYMFMGLGAGAYAAGMFHVFTHAFFKACLFLGSGSVIHALHHSFPHGMDAQDMRSMGGMKKYMPITFLTFAVSVVAIAGIFPFAGFWSKDEILWQVFDNAAKTPWPWAYYLFYALGLVGAMMTAFYMTRQLVMTFFGEYRGRKASEEYLRLHPHGHDDHDEAGHGSHDAHAMADDHVSAATAGKPAMAAAHGHQAGAAEDDLHAHDREPEHADLHDPEESPWQITVPLVLLACGAVAAGFLGLGNWARALTGIPNVWERWLAPVTGAGEEIAKTIADTTVRPGFDPKELLLAAVSVGLAAASMWWAWTQYSEGAPAPARRLALYGPGGAQSGSLAGKAYRWIYNKYYVDEIYNAVFVEGVGKKGAAVLGWFDRVIVDGFFNFLGYLTLFLRWAIGVFDAWVIDGLLIGALFGSLIDAIGRGVRQAQSGDLQRYLRFVAYGAIACIGIYFWILAFPGGAHP